jgi:hypothetical protein
VTGRGTTPYGGVSRYGSHPLHTLPGPHHEPIAEHDALLRGVRAGWATQPALRESYRKHRPNVERVISQIASRGGRRLKLRYRGAARNNAWLKRRTATLNLRNLINQGLTREHST